MKVTESMHGPPTTRLRPLHSHQQLAEERLGNGALNVQNTRESTSRILQRSSSIAKRFERNVCIRAFVKLVSCLVILDTGERYCIQDSARGGYILARSASSTEANIEETSDDDYSFIELSDDHEVPSDFSVGEGKVSRHMHGDESEYKVISIVVFVADSQARHCSFTSTKKLDKYGWRHMPIWYRRQLSKPWVACWTTFF